MRMEFEERRNYDQLRRETLSREWKGKQLNYLLDFNDLVKRENN